MPHTDATDEQSRGRTGIPPSIFVGIVQKLREEGEKYVSVSKIYEAAKDEDGVNVTKRTVRNKLSDAREAGALDREQLPNSQNWYISDEEVAQELIDAATTDAQEDDEENSTDE